MFKIATVTGVCFFPFHVFFFRTYQTITALNKIITYVCLNISETGLLRFQRKEYLFLWVGLCGYCWKDISALTDYFNVFSFLNETKLNINPH